jgi:hypothetical protein
MDFTTVGSAITWQHDLGSPRAKWRSEGDAAKSRLSVSP